jgi:hypothetical protein
MRNAGLALIIIGVVVFFLSNLSAVFIALSDMPIEYLFIGLGAGVLLIIAGFVIIVWSSIATSSVFNSTGPNDPFVGVDPKGDGINMAICKNCGKSYDTDIGYKNCPYCGKRLW